MSPAESTAARDSPRLAALEALVLVAGLGAVLVLADALAVSWAGPPAILGAVALIALRLRGRGQGLAALGLSRPRRIWLTLLGAVGAWIFVLLSTAFAAQLVGGQPDVSELSFVEGNPAGLAGMLAVAWTSAAFGEEIVFRGFLMPRLARALGGSRPAWLSACAAQAALFGLAHAYQGPVGIVLTGSVGLSVGLCVLVARGSLWVAVLTHGIVDTVGLVALYLGLAS